MLRGYSPNESLPTEQPEEQISSWCQPSYSYFYILTNWFVLFSIYIQEIIYVIYNIHNEISSCTESESNLIQFNSQKIINSFSDSFHRTDLQPFANMSNLCRPRKVAT